MMIRLSLDHHGILAERLGRSCRSCALYAGCPVILTLEAGLKGLNQRCPEYATWVSVEECEQYAAREDYREFVRDRKET